MCRTCSTRSWGENALCAAHITPTSARPGPIVSRPLMICVCVLSLSLSPSRPAFPRLRICGQPAICLETSTSLEIKSLSDDAPGPASPPSLVVPPRRVSSTLREGCDACCASLVLPVAWFGRHELRGADHLSHALPLQAASRAQVSTPSRATWAGSTRSPQSLVWPLVMRTHGGHSENTTGATARADSWESRICRSPVKTSLVCYTSVLISEGRLPAEANTRVS